MSDFLFEHHIVRDDILSLIPGKTLDNNNAPDMVTTISNASSRGYRWVILNMSNLEFLSSAGVGSILGTVEMFRESGGDIILCHVSPNIMHVLEVLDLAEYLTIRTTAQDAEQLASMTS